MEQLLYAANLKLSGFRNRGVLVLDRQKGCQVRVHMASDIWSHGIRFYTALLFCVPVSDAEFGWGRTCWQGIQGQDPRQRPFAAVATAAYHHPS
jgi:hypothetical protein